jgi:hypothetical protein
MISNAFCKHITHKKGLINIFTYTITNIYKYKNAYIPIKTTYLVVSGEILVDHGIDAAFRGRRGVTGHFPAGERLRLDPGNATDTTEHI